MSVKSVICTDNAYLYDNKTCLLACPSRFLSNFLFLFY